VLFWDLESLSQVQSRRKTHTQYKYNDTMIAESVNVNRPYFMLFQCIDIVIVMVVPK
jgi:hypothetical protein